MDDIPLITKVLADQLTKQDAQMDRFETELSEQEQKMEALEDTCLALVHSLQELEGAVRQQGAASGVPYPSPLDNADMSTAMHVKSQVDRLVQSMSGQLAAAAEENGAGGAYLGSMSPPRNTSGGSAGSDGTSRSRPVSIVEATDIPAQIYGIKSGYLYKRTSGKGMSISKFKKRWFVVKPSGMIVYAHTPDDLQTGSAQELDLGEYNIQIATEHQKENSFKATRPGQRTYFFRPEPDTDEKRAEWMVSFSEAAAKRTDRATTPRTSFSGGSRPTSMVAPSPTPSSGSQENSADVEVEPVHLTTEAVAGMAASSAASASVVAPTVLAAAAAAAPPPEPEPEPEPVADPTQFACSEASLAGAAMHGWLERMEPGGAWGKLYYVLNGTKLFRFNNPKGQIPLGFSEIKSAMIDFVFDDDPIVDGKERVMSIKLNGEREKMYLSSDNDDDFGLWFSGLNNVAQLN